MIRNSEGPPLFTPGDIVHLRSGSPKYTVVSVDGDIIKIVWSVFDTHAINTQDIPAIALVKESDDRRTRIKKDRPY